LEKKKFLLVDNRVIVRFGMKTLLLESYNSPIVDEATDLQHALEKLSTEYYDLVILDIQIPNSDPFDLLQFLQIKYPRIKVLVFTMGAEKVYAGRLIKAGARGFISKSSSLDEIRKAISTILNDQKYISEKLIEILADSGGNKDSNLFNTLSAREFEITTLLLKGETISKIAGSLKLGVSTVGTHKARIYDKLKVSNLLELKELANIYNL